MAQAHTKGKGYGAFVPVIWLHVTEIGIYIYIYIYEHEAIRKPISENNLGVP